MIYFCIKLYFVFNNIKLNEFHVSCVLNQFNIVHSTNPHKLNIDIDGYKDE